MLVWIPIPLGTNRAWAWGMLEAVSFILLAVWLVLWALDAVRVGEVVRRSWPAWIALACWLALQVFHVIPLPATVVTFLSPESARMHELVDVLGVEQGFI